MIKSYYVSSKKLVILKSYSNYLGFISNLVVYANYSKDYFKDGYCGIFCV